MANEQAIADQTLTTLSRHGALASDVAATVHITSELGVGVIDFVRFFGRVKNLLRVGLLPDRQTSRGRRSTLTLQEYRRLKWASLLTSCDITPATVVRMMEGINDDALAAESICVALGSEMHGHSITITATLPKEPQRVKPGRGNYGEVTSFIHDQHAEPASAFGPSQVDEAFYADLCGEVITEYGCSANAANTHSGNYTGANVSSPPPTFAIGDGE